MNRHQTRIAAAVLAAILLLGVLAAAVGPLLALATP